ncbi:hypothetical protein [Hydrogenophaga sp. 2FB]|nr:hypothetical protein [Hydrogenophaga sp. 2FB]
MGVPRDAGVRRILRILANNWKNAEFQIGYGIPVKYRLAAENQALDPL